MYVFTSLILLCQLVKPCPCSALTMGTCSAWCVGIVYETRLQEMVYRSVYNIVLYIKNPASQYCTYLQKY